MIAGNAKECGRDPGAPNVWSCLASDVDGDPGGVMCPSMSALELILNFPDCWDGRRLDSRNHQAPHGLLRRRRVSGEAPGRHAPDPAQDPLAVARAAPGVALASGNGYSAHGDFMNAWRPRALNRRIATCLRAVVKCGADGKPLR